MDNKTSQQELLFYYINQQDVDAVRALIQDDVLADAMDSEGNTPLNKAVAVGNVDVLRVLLDAGADVNAVNRAGFSPLLSAAIYDKIDICRELIDAGAGPGREVPFPAANSNGNVYLSPYQTAMRLGKEAIAWLLFERFEEDPNQLTASNMTMEILVANASDTREMLRLMRSVWTEKQVRRSIDIAGSVPDVVPIKRSAGMSPL